MRRWLRDLWKCLKNAVTAFSRRNGSLLAGSIAFYAMLSVAPLLVVALHVASIVTGEGVARAALLENLSHYIGNSGASTLGALMDRVQRPGAGWRGALTTGVLIYASTRLFDQLQSAIDHMWDLPEPQMSLLKEVRQFALKRLINFGLVIGTGAMLVALVVAKLGYDVVRAKLQIATTFTSSLGEIALSLVSCTLLFAALLRWLPDATLRWRHALLGAGFTAALFSPGAYAISAYLSRQSIASTYGGAGSIVVLLLWVHYSAQIFLLGATFTGEWVRIRGGFIEAGPKRASGRARRGMP